MSNYCKECGLSTDVHPIFDTASTTGKLFFVRLMPGWQENKRHIPFCDAGGQMLRELVRGTALEQHAYYTYVVHCFRFKMAVNENGWHYKRGVLPKRTHKMLCYQSYMLDALALRNPDFIVAFGKDAFKEMARVPDEFEWGQIYSDQETPEYIWHSL